MAKVLLFQCKNEEEIRQLLTPMKIRTISVPPDQFHLTLGELERGKFSQSKSSVPSGNIVSLQGKKNDFSNISEKKSPVSEEMLNHILGGGAPASSFESLMVMCDVSEKQMNRLLLELRRKEIKIDYKAMLTPTNREWNVRHMYMEMAKERAMYMQMKK